MIKNPYFSEEEMSCKCGQCSVHMSDTFMERLIKLRKAYNKPMIITSGYRCHDYNAQIGGAENSAHTLGHAVDVSVRGADAYRLVYLAMNMGFTGVGVSQKGTSARFIHLDDMQDDIRRPRVWSY